MDNEAQRQLAIKAYLVVSSSILTLDILIIMLNIIHHMIILYVNCYTILPGRNVCTQYKIMY